VKLQKYIVQFCKYYKKRKYDENNCKKKLGKLNPQKILKIGGRKKFGTRIEVEIESRKFDFSSFQRKYSI
jgi:hypothetical protein